MRKRVPGVLFITSYPPRECGIATFSSNLLEMLEKKFGSSFRTQICALETNAEKYAYGSEVIANLNTDMPEAFPELATRINHDETINLVVVQHEFGFFFKNEATFQRFLFSINKPIILVFHTVLPTPNPTLKRTVEQIVSACKEVVVMTYHSKKLLVDNYDIPRRKISVIPHGTHLVKHLGRDNLKKSYGFEGRKILSTFGLLNAGKSIETTLDALPDIVSKNPDVLFLIIGKTHPVVLEKDGEAYREMLQQKVTALHLEKNVQFINHYLELSELMRYLQLTDIYLFTSRDPNQAVSGTFAYALSCACAIVSTPIPHAMEVLTEDTGMLFDFGDSVQLATCVNQLLEDDMLREQLSMNALQKIILTAWENSAIGYARLLSRHTAGEGQRLRYDLPPLNMYHIRQMTTSFGMIQFAKSNQPDKKSGYTIDDNARAMIAVCAHYEYTKDHEDIDLIRIYLNFIRYCQQKDGSFLNYVAFSKAFTKQNEESNLEDANGRTIWALGFVSAQTEMLPSDIPELADLLLINALPYIKTVRSPRAISFIIKGLFYYNKRKKALWVSALIRGFADKLAALYEREADKDWKWYEPYLTYANSILPEAMLLATIETGDFYYREIARSSFDFLIEQTFDDRGIRVISNKSWMYKGEEAALYGEQPIDVAYTILALSRFYEVFGHQEYLDKLHVAFDWFLGNNHLHQIIYNPCTGGCYDGLEQTQVNLNQGAESTVSYLLARLTVAQQPEQERAAVTIRKQGLFRTPFPRLKGLNPGPKLLK